MNWLASNKQNAWLMVPTLAFLEACPGIGLFVSGVILLTVSTLLYSEQLMSISQIMALAFIGACLSDHLGFYIGRWFGPKLRSSSFAKRRSESSKLQCKKNTEFFLNGKNFNPLGCRNIRIGCFKGLGQSNNPIFCWYVSKHIWRCKIMRWKSRYRCCVDNSSSSASLDLKKNEKMQFSLKSASIQVLTQSSYFCPIAQKCQDF